MNKFLVFASVFSVLLVFSLFFLLNKPDVGSINCSTFYNIEKLSDPKPSYYGCDVQIDISSGLVMKVVNLKDYKLLFGKFLFVNLVQVKDDIIYSKWYPVKFFKAGGVSLEIKDNPDLSSESPDHRVMMDIHSFKKWLDNNDFKNKQVMAILYNKEDQKTQYFMGMSVYKDDVKSN